MVYPTLQSGAQPEYSYRLKPLVDANRKHRRRVARVKDSSHRLARPIRLCRPMLIQATFEEKAETTGSSVRDLHRPPVAIEIAGRVYQVVDAWGPERIETGWWRGPTVCRDYWRIVSEEGQHFWVYRDLRCGRWWLHGNF